MKLIASDLQYIWFSRWLAFKKSRKVEVVFTFWRTKRMIKCSVKCQSQAKLKTKQCADDELKESFLKELNAKSDAHFPQSSSSFSWFLAGCVVNNQKFPVE